MKTFSETLGGLNWAVGLNRLYNTVWALLFTYYFSYTLAKFGLFSVDMLLLGIAGGVLPYLGKSLLIWLIAGFTKKPV